MYGRRATLKAYLCNGFTPMYNDRFNHCKGGRVKFNLEQATKAQRGSRGIALLFYLGAR